MAKIKLTREERLAQALRDNLRKRKATAQGAADQLNPSKSDEMPAPRD
jgi:hypothetical protein